MKYVKEGHADRRGRTGGSDGALNGSSKGQISEKGTYP
jgi:hypothetical protein